MKLPESVYGFEGAGKLYTEAQMLEMYCQGLEDAARLLRLAERVGIVPKGFSETVKGFQEQAN